MPTEDDLRELCPDAFAGSWLDERGHLMVAYTSDPEKHAAAARSRFGSRLTGVRHRYALADLEAIAKEIDSQVNLWFDHGVVFSVVEIDVEKNRVVVVVDDRTPTVIQAFGRRYGQAVAVEEGRAELVSPP